MSGQYAPAGSPHCTPCKRGSFQTLPGQEYCAPCPVGSACVEGAQAAAPCLVGFYLPYEHAASQAECIKCPPFSSTVGTGTASLAGCRCDVSFYNSNTSGGVTCAPCPVGTRCVDPGMELDSLPVRTGYYRPDAAIGNVHRCPDASVGCSTTDVEGECIGSTSGCKGGDNVTTQCAPSLSGILCQRCKAADTFYIQASAREAARCEACVETMGSTLGVLGAIAALAVITPWALTATLRRHPRIAACFACARRSFAEQLTLANTLKILCGFYQISTKVPRVYQVTLPASVQQVLTAIEVLVSFEFAAAPLQCTGVRSQTQRLAFWIVLPLMLVACVACVAGIQLALRGTTQRELQRQRPWAARLVEASAPGVLKVLFLAYPIVTTVAFESFPCYDFGEAGLWLTADVTIRCGSREHRSLTALAWFAIALYPVGLLAAYAWLLVNARKAIMQQRPTVLSQALAFLHQEYRPAFWWWELVDMLRRLLLVGFAVVVLPGSINQLALALLVAVLYLVLELQAAPFCSPSDGVLAMGGSLSLVLLFASCVVLKAGTLTELPGIQARLSPSLSANYSVRGALLSSALLLSVIGTAALSALLLSQQLAAARLQRLREERLADARRLREIASHKEMVVPTLPSADGYHLFLSHVWSTGQDQMRVVKQRLREMLPGIKVFLDVDVGDLEIGDLQRYIVASQHVLVFCTEGFFSSRNCIQARDSPRPLLHRSASWE